MNIDDQTWSTYHGLELQVLTHCHFLSIHCCCHFLSIHCCCPCHNELSRWMTFFFGDSNQRVPPSKASAAVEPLSWTLQGTPQAHVAWTVEDGGGAGAEEYCFICFATDRANGSRSLQIFFNFGTRFCRDHDFTAVPLREASPRASGRAAPASHGPCMGDHQVPVRPNWLST